MNIEDYVRSLALHGLKYKRPKPEIITLSEDHSLYCMTYKGKVAKARVIMAEHLGRSLTRNEIVCYKDDFPLNTDIDNLELRDRQYIWQDTVEWGTERDAEESANYQTGKIEEERIASNLSEHGFSVVDISTTRHYNQDGTTTYSPFDLYVWSEHHSFLADVKYRSSKGDLYFSKKLLDLYLSYWSHIQVADKILIIVTPKVPDSFISISSILDDGKTCVVERWKTRTLNTLIAILADSRGIKGDSKLKWHHVRLTPEGNLESAGAFPYPQENLDQVMPPPKFPTNSKW